MPWSRKIQASEKKQNQHTKQTKTNKQKLRAQVILEQNILTYKKQS